MGLIKTHGNGEIVGLSLSELLMLVSFIFLVVLVLFARDLHRAKEVNEEAQKLSQAVRKAAEVARVLDELLFLEDAPPQAETGAIADALAVTELLARVEATATEPEAQEVLEETELPEVWSALIATRQMLADKERLVTTLKAGNERLSALVDQVQTLEQEKRDAKKALEQQRLDMQKAQEDLKNELMAHQKSEAAMQAVLDAAGVRSVKELVHEVEVKEGRIANLRKRAGVGDPPCWTTKDGGFEYLYTIFIKDQGFVIDKAWPEYRAAELSSIGAPGLRYPSRKISPEKFQTMMRPLWDYGRKHDRCRFFVRVVDQTSPVSKEAWQTNLQLVENYFYKSVVKK